MEQRPLRLGDTVDDYCTREKRVTNHVIVAIVEDAIRNTRCTTCDTEHPYKSAKEPRLRKKPGLPDEALAKAAPGEAPNGAVAAAAGPSPGSSDMITVVDAGRAEDAPGEDPSGAAPEDGWPAHRTLIRATLPKTENDQPVPRPIPEFTMHQRPQGRSGHGFRHAGHAGYGHGSGQGNSRGNPNGNGNVNGNGNGPQRQPAGGGRPGRHRRRRPR